MHHNIQCIGNKVELIESVNILEHPDGICINEHRLQQQEIKSYIPSGFLLGSPFCRKATLRGGSCIFVSDKNRFEVLDISNCRVELICEAAKVLLLDFDILVVSLYQTPCSSIWEFFIYFQSVG